MRETKISKGLYVVTSVPWDKRGYHYRPVPGGIYLFGLESNIWKFEDGKKVLIATRRDSVLDMFAYRNVLYDVSRSNIHITLLDPSGEKPGARNLLEVRTVCNYNEELYAIGGGMSVSQDGQVTSTAWCGQIFKISGYRASG